MTPKPRFISEVARLPRLGKGELARAISESGKSLLAAVCCAVALGASAQPAPPVAVSLGAYAQSLQSPARIAVDAAGRAYVTDPQAGQVVVFDAFGRPIATHSGFARPLGIAVDVQGKIYLAEEGAGSVSVFSDQWNLLYKLGQGNGELQLPNHIALDAWAAGNTVYVSDSKANTVRVYVGTKLDHTIGSGGTSLGKFDFPSGVCVSTSNEVFVVDQGNDRIQVFGPTGNFLQAFYLGSTAVSGRSQAAFLDAAGRIFVADSFQGIVKVFNRTSGALLANVGSFGKLPGQLDSPAGLALDNLNRLFVTSANTHRVELYGLDSFIHLTIEPASVTIAAGTNLTLRALTGGAGNFTYQWLKNGSVIAGATNGTLTILGVTLSHAGNYSVVVSGPAGTFTSSAAAVMVVAPPKILSEPASLTVLRGSNAVFTVGAEGTALNYQWLFGGSSIADATNDTLVLASVEPFQAGFYSVRISNLIGAIISAPASLTVTVPPAIMEIANSSMDTNQLFHLTVNADLGFVYSLDASTNLFDWEPLLNFTNDLGLIEFIDADSTNYWNRFYRLRWLP